MCNMSSEKVRLLFECGFYSSAAFNYDFTVYKNWLVKGNLFLKSSTSDMRSSAK